MLKVAILGGSGYTGLELLRILARHKGVEVGSVTSRQYSGKRIPEVFPCLRGYYDNLKFTEPSGFPGMDAELFFLSLPHGASQEVAPKLLKGGKRIVDLSADFRLKDPRVYEKWYGRHKSKGLLKYAVYGLPELFREEIKTASLVANPGCYPTSALLALAPFFNGDLRGVIDAGSIIIDSKSGVSGAGRAPTLETSFVEISEGFRAYKVASHRHTPEMEEVLKGLSGKNITLTFTPHLLPVARGILTTVYAGIKKPVKTAALLKYYKDYYRGEPFVRVCGDGTLPDIRFVRGSNYCDIGLEVDERTKRVIIISAIDNLVKGASGQAVQNMNIMSGFDEQEALNAPPV
ncbi:MAG: N-acetyl-gamma-glutamyl-phosphate reductase [Deltaproteobacteria bacterium]|nr:N-acetyl-gamma-glutamyl-phosphate reductase [Deltaproteobacteria bacterium]